VLTTAAGPSELESAYAYCRRVNARHGKTFYLATALLPPPVRPHVHALYGFARYADDLVDRPEPGTSATDRLAALGAELARGLAGGAAPSPVVRAVSATARRYAVPSRLFTDFLASMTADLTVTGYPDFAALRGYMWGSASVIGLQLLPVLGVVGDRAAAERSAAELGIAFQLTNFLRDVGEDHRRGRVYLPRDTLDRHGVTEPMLAAARTAPELKAALAEEIERARGFYRSARPGIALLAPDARDCVRTAATLYAEILDEIERAGYEVLARRAAVGRRRRLTVGLAGYRHARRARRAPSTTG